MKSNALKDIFHNHTGNLIHKWDHYFDIYEKYFSRYKGQKVNILEIGINHGGSLQLWKKYFGDKVHVYAIDFNPECKKLEEENTTIFIGSQSDRQFLRETLLRLPELDIILDDGGHVMIQQKVSFEELYMKLKEGGVYMVEDTHTSYWSEFGGGLKNRNSFIEYAKNLIDSLYDGHIKNQKNLLVNEISRHINSISFYDSIVVFEKQKRQTPFHERRGHETIREYDYKLGKKSFLGRIKSKLWGEDSNTFKRNSK